MSSLKPGRPKSEEKKNAIHRAAADLFLENGYANTSMEQVAKVSGVSKQTVYSHYRNKDALFSAVIAAKCEEYKLRASADNIPPGEPQERIKQVLTHMATQLLELFHDSEVIAMYTTVIAEAKNTPHVAEVFYQAGPQASLQSLGETLILLSEGQLAPRDAYLVSIDFMSLLKSDIHVRSLLNLPFALSESKKKAFVTSVVDRVMCLINQYYGREKN